MRLTIASLGDWRQHRYGYLTSQYPLQAGAKVYISSRRQKFLDEAIKSLGPDTCACVSDVTDPVDRAGMIAKTKVLFRPPCKRWASRPTSANTSVLTTAHQSIFSKTHQTVSIKPETSSVSQQASIRIYRL